MKTLFLTPTLIVLGLSLISFSLTACGQRGELIRPVPQGEQSIPLESAEKKPEKDL